MNCALIFIFIIYILSSLISSISPTSLSSSNASDEFRTLERNKRKYDFNDRKKETDDFKSSDFNNPNFNLNQLDNDNYCVVGDICGVGGGVAGDANIPCHIKAKPHTINDTEARDILRTICPILFKNNQENPAVCCSADQVREMEQNFANPRDLGMGKCPSCMQNFRTLHCEMTCSPRQSKFLQVVGHEVIYDKKAINSARSRSDDEDEDEAKSEKLVKPVNIEEPKDSKNLNKTDYLLTEMNYFLDKEFVSTLYESCRNVKSVMGGQLIDVLCGVPPCSPTKWLKFMGTSYLRKGFSPFQINYIPVENQVYSSLEKVKSVNKLDRDFVTNLSNLTTIEPMSSKTYQCYERINNELGACICADCEKTCDVLIQNALPNPGYPQMLSAQNFTVFLGWLLFVMVVIGVFSYFLLVALKKRRTYSRMYF